MWWVVGIVIGLTLLFTYALCVAAGRADRHIYYIDTERNLHSNKENN